MTKDELKALGLNDEQVDAVFAAYGKALNATKTELETVKTERDGLQTQLEQQTAAVKELTDKQEADSATKAQLEQLTADFETFKTTAAEELAATKKANAIALAVRDTGTIDPDVLVSLINADDVKLGDDGKADLGEIVETLRTSKPYLFPDAVATDSPAPTEQIKPTPRFTPAGNPSGEGNGTVDPFQAVVDSYK